MVDERRGPDKQEAEDLRIGRILEEGMKTEFWKIYSKLLSSHIDMKVTEMVGEVRPGEDGVNYALRMAANKGAILGLKLALSLPSGIVQGQTKPLREKLFGNSASED